MATAGGTGAAGRPMERARPRRGPAGALARAVFRDALIAALFVVLMLGSVWGYTGQPFPSRAPLVVVESGSMMQPDAAFGRLDSIEPGDLVLVKRAGGAGDIATADSTPARRGYGGPGDVIVYRPNGDPARTPIIHRAVAWVEVEGEGEAARYTVREWGLEDVASVTYAPRRVFDWKPAHEGFVTQGDNPATNPRPDQVTQPPLSGPVRPEWVVGKARGEVPWIGLVKLAFSGTPPAPDRGWCTVLLAAAPCDAWVMLGVTALGLAAVPLGWDAVTRRLRRAR